MQIGLWQFVVMEERTSIKFCFKNRKTAIETFQLIKQAYGDNALSLSLVRVLKWHARFLDDRKNLEDDEPSERPTAVRALDMIETVRELIATDRRMTLWTEEELEIGRQTIRKILVEDLVKRKAFARFVPHSLMDEQKALRLQACQEIIQSVDDGRSLLDAVVSADETWCFQHDPQTKPKHGMVLAKLSKMQTKF
jgi:hypothetical protein